MKSGSQDCLRACMLSYLRNSQDSTVFLCVYVALAVASTFLNTLVICTILFSKELQGSFYVILTSLFASDLIAGTVIFPMMAAISALSMPRNCTLMDTCQYFAHTISLSTIFSMLAIAYDRYLRVAKRHAYNVFMTKAKGFVIVTSIWAAAILLGLLSIVVSAKVVAFTALCVICLILYLYLMMLKKMRSNVNQVPVDVPARAKVKNHDNGIKRSSRLVFILVLVMFMSWCPYIINSMLSCSSRSYLSTAIHQLPLLSAITSPFLYFWTNKTTRRSLVAFFLKLYCKKAEAAHIATVCTQ